MNFSNLAYTVTNGTINHTIGMALDTLYTLAANSHRYSQTRFYYNQAAGGSVLQVAVKGLVGGAVGALKDEVVNEFKSLLKGKDKELDKNGTEWTNNALAKQKYEEEKYGSFPVNDGGNVVLALDDWGNKCSDALMLGIPVDNPIPVSQTYYQQNFKKYKRLDGQMVDYQTKSTKKVNSFSSDHIVWYDCTALVNMSSDKNIVITPVQGRDYSRKELVSNGDIKFSVSGQISSGLPDVYPEEEINKLWKILQYKGIVEVVSQTLNSRGITKIVITDFSLPQKEGYKALQEYSFNAIGVQPESDVEVTEDTLAIIEQKFAEQ